MNTNILTLLLAFSTITLSAQNFQGKAYYTSKANYNLALTNRQMSETMKDRIKEQLKSISTQNYILEFNSDVSLFIEEEKIEEVTTPMGQNRMTGMKMILGSQDDGNFYKDLSKGIYINQKDLYGKIFSIKDSLKAFDWKLENELKVIGNYTCFKATTTINNKNPVTLPFNRNPEKDKKKEGIKAEPEVIIVTAWYTVDIPIKQGPGRFWGLPGLIIEIHSGDHVLLCTKIELSRDKIQKIDPPKKGKKVNQKEYDKIYEKKIQEFKDRFKNGKGRGLRGRN